MLDSWQSLLGQPIDTSGYDNAIQHYTNLKNKMLDQITQQAKIQMSQAGYKDFINNIETLILQNASEWGDSYKKAQNTLSKIEAAVCKIIENGSINEVKQVLSEIKTEVYSKKQKLKNAQQTFKLKLNANKDQIFNAIGIDNQFIENMIGVQGKEGNMSDIVAQASSYFLRYLYARLFNESSFSEGSRFKYAMSLGGYYKELHEYESLEKILEGLLNVYHAGSTKIGGKDTEVDILFSTLNDLEHGLEQNVKITQMISALVEPPGSEDLTENLIAQIEHFGEQVKSKRLGKSSQFEIGNRASLYSRFLSEGGSEYSSLQALHFLARYKNILLSLGASNVLFSSNKKRQWTADFINDFRNQAYLLSFMRKSNKEKLNTTVGLEQLYTSSKTNIRARFLS